MAIPYSRYIIGSIPWYSVLMVSGIFIAYLLGAREEWRVGLPKDAMLDMVLVAVPCGIVGARLYYVLMSLDQFAANPISVLYIWEGGIAVYGAVIGGILGVAVQCRIRKRSLWALLDISAPGLVLAQAIGRWGNYFNREAYGPALVNPALQFFPFGVLIGDGDAAVWHMATFFYESMWNLGVFAVLWAIRKRVKRRGDVFLWYMALYGSGRFLVEQLRQDSLYLFGVRASQYVSLLMCGAVAAVFAVRYWKARGKIAAADQATSVVSPAVNPSGRNTAESAVTKGASSASQPSANKVPSGMALPWLSPVGVTLGCLIPFVRLVLPADALTAALTFALIASCGLCLALAQSAPRFAFWWLGLDACVYALLLCLGADWLWHSPYFLYAGLSIAPYLAIPYVGLPKQSPAA